MILVREETLQTTFFGRLLEELHSQTENSLKFSALGSVELLS